MRGKEAKVVLESVSDINKLTNFTKTSTTGGSKDGGAFHAIITAGSGDNGCILSMKKSLTTLTTTFGKGGLYSCTGTGKASITFS